MAASFQLNVDNVAKIVCPHCNKPSDNIGLALNLTVGPVPDGVQVLMVRPGATMRAVVDDVRRALINDALVRARGNQAGAAKLLGMKYTTFHTLARRLGIERVKKRHPDDVGEVHGEAS
jgi:transcriptional regulator with GAF, ATPase, and Fis domain